ncbi:ArsR/SmtB family transcription factor [Poseidonibacter antarcticus]|uniref:ArsR/SmtB family transcription factor n=1 Tax=Poseidonibacter antarcticus TaxID=2478538 RepID=UPI000EF4FD18|nr:metalloregulator ArsR/SmtB family transcription factor [Poseidonibacter antarcticus]
MNEEKLSNCLAQLGNITRLKIFKLLVKAGEKGLSVGKIQEQLDVPGSTLSHHLTKLLNADLIQQIRDGRTLHCIANFELLELLICDLKDQCCIGIE